LCVVVVLVFDSDEEELPDLSPHPATTTVVARMAKIVSMAASGVLLMWRAPIVARGLEGAAYQAFPPPIAVG
jgi:hypothetical protein